MKNLSSSYHWVLFSYNPKKEAVSASASSNSNEAKVEAQLTQAPKPTKKKRPHRCTVHAVLWTLHPNNTKGLDLNGQRYSYEIQIKNCYYIIAWQPLCQAKFNRSLYPNHDMYSKEFLIF